MHCIFFVTIAMKMKTLKSIFINIIIKYYNYFGYKNNKQIPFVFFAY
jgi:hypothetical protein